MNQKFDITLMLKNITSYFNGYYIKINFDNFDVLETIEKMQLLNMIAVLLIHNIIREAGEEWAIDKDTHMPYARTKSYIRTDKQVLESEYEAIVNEVTGEQMIKSRNQGQTNEI